MLERIKPEIIKKQDRAQRKIRKKREQIEKLDLKNASVLSTDNTVYVFDTFANETKRLREIGMVGNSKRGFHWHVPKADRT